MLQEEAMLIKKICRLSVKELWHCGHGTRRLSPTHLFVSVLFHTGSNL